MTDRDPVLASTLDALVPSFEGVPADWDDVLRRGRAPRPRRRVLLAVAAAAFAAGLLATTGFGESVLRTTFDQLGSWVGASPGEPASPQQQAAFDAADARSYAHLPPGTEVGRLLSTTLDGVRYELLGFRDGGSLCLRLTGPKDEDPPPAACAPQRQLVDLGQPAAVLQADQTFIRDGKLLATAVYGVAADAVDRVELETASGARQEAQLGNNAFLSLSPGNGAVPRRNPAIGPVRALVHLDGGESATIPVEVGLRIPQRTAAELPGPTTTDRTLGPAHVAWLEHGEPRGDPYPWTGNPGLTVKTSRVIQPDPTSSFKLAVAYGTDSYGTERYCSVWLWPLVKGSGNAGCSPAGMSGALPATFGTGEGADQFPLYSGLAADEVASLELFFPNGAHQDVPLKDNVYAFQAPWAVPTKLVAYDAQHRVVGILVL